MTSSPNISNARLAHTRIADFVEDAVADREPDPVACVLTRSPGLSLAVVSKQEPQRLREAFRPRSLAVGGTFVDPD